MLKNFEGDQMTLYDLDLCVGKMCPALSPAERKKEKTSGLYWRKYAALKSIPYMYLDLTPGHGNLLGESDWEMISPWRGDALMLNTGVSPREEKESSLSQILQENPPLKYYLTRKACKGILRRSHGKEKKLPDKLERALSIQAGLSQPDGKGTDINAYHINQRDEGIDLHGVPGALMATSNMQMQTFITQPEDMYLLCLNDQGGERMGCTVEKAATLRAQEHGHQPLIMDISSPNNCQLYENHGVDARYTGPHRVAPTMSARYGTGGNNVPLVNQSPPEHSTERIEKGDSRQQAVFGRQRVDVFRESDVVSTESARQHKDATDLVYQDAVGALTSSDFKGPNSQYVSQDKCVVVKKYLIRRLTPLECERLQGFPDGWTDIVTASDSARYKALGNSVAVPCVEYILSRIALVLKTT